MGFEPMFPKLQVLAPDHSVTTSSEKIKARIRSSGCFYSSEDGDGNPCVSDSGAGDV